MATGWSATAGNAALTTLTNTYDWVQLHTGDPGSAGTANVATEDTRLQASFGSAASGEIATSANLEWTNVGGSETYSHFTVWTAETDGTFGFSGTVTANAVTSGDDFTIETGDLTVAVDLATTE